MSAELILARLERVRQRAPSQWSASCPAHSDKSPSLSIRETPDGRVLMHCFGGCTADEICGAIGLELTALFPPKPRAPGGGYSSLAKRSVLTPMQALELLDKEAQVVFAAAGALAKGDTLPTRDRTRVLKAAAKIAYVRRECMA
jgi:hypothetical protein